MPLFSGGCSKGSFGSSPVSPDFCSAEAKTDGRRAQPVDSRAVISAKIANPATRFTGLHHRMLARRLPEFSGGGREVTRTTAKSCMYFLHGHPGLLWHPPPLESLAGIRVRGSGEGAAETSCLVHEWLPSSRPGGSSSAARRPWPVAANRRQFDKCSIRLTRHRITGTNSDLCPYCPRPDQTDCPIQQTVLG